MKSNKVTKHQEINVGEQNKTWVAGPARVGRNTIVLMQSTDMKNRNSKKTNYRIKTIIFDI